MKSDSSQRVVLITGATDGIGLELARLYRAQGARLLLLGRRGLSELPAPLFTAETYLPTDLKDAEAPAALVQFLVAHGIDQVDLAVHNAGMGHYGPLDDPPESVGEQIRVNLVAPMALTRILIPYLGKAKGTLTFITSMVTDLPCKKYSVYGATKTALEGFARSLRIELKNRILVRIIRPGATRTGLHLKMGIPKDEVDYDRFAPAAKTALNIAQAIERRSNSTIGLFNKGIRGLGRRLPARIFERSGCPAPMSAARICVITGAADGIGRALAFEFSKAGYRIVGVDIDPGKAEETRSELERSGRTCEFIIKDLTLPKEREETLNLLTRLGPFSVVIHNAGISAVGRFEHLDWAQIQRVMDLNLQAPLYLTLGLLQRAHLIRRGSLVFMSSLSKFVGYPGAAAYAASKDGLASFAKSLRWALRKKHHVLTVFPGPTRTGHARRYSPDNRWENRRMAPEYLADKVLRAVKNRSPVLIPGFRNRLAAFLGSAAPRATETLLEKTILRKLDRLNASQPPGLPYEKPLSKTAAFTGISC